MWSALHAVCIFVSNPVFHSSSECTELLTNGVLFSRYRPGQEEGNVPFVEDSGFGKYSANPTVIADTVSSWLSSPEKLDSMKKSALAAARPSATLDIAKDLADMVFATREQKEELVASN